MVSDLWTGWKNSEARREQTLERQARPEGEKRRGGRGEGGQEEGRRRGGREEEEREDEGRKEGGGREEEREEGETPGLDIPSLRSSK